jgi:hypothetical protein
VQGGAREGGVTDGLEEESELDLFVIPNGLAHEESVVLSARREADSSAYAALSVGMARLLRKTCKK